MYGVFHDGKFQGVVSISREDAEHVCYDWHGRGDPAIWNDERMEVRELTVEEAVTLLREAEEAEEWTG